MEAASTITKIAIPEQDGERYGCFNTCATQYVSHARIESRKTRRGEFKPARTSATCIHCRYALQ